ncbi:hypothetical protein AOLI_G00263000 [Acnodon oligacanthus]
MSGKPETATAIIQSYCDSVREKVETSVGRPYEVYVAKTFLSRPWEGNSYMIKVMFYSLSSQARKSREQFSAFSS